MSHEQVEQYRHMAGESSGLRHIAGVVGCSPVAAKRVLNIGLDSEASQA